MTEPTKPASTWLLGTNPAGGYAQALRPGLAHRPGCAETGDAEPWWLAEDLDETRLRVVLTGHPGVSPCPVCLPEPAPPGPPWQLRDVVRAADTDHAEDVWVYLPDADDDDVPWKSIDDDGEWLSRDALPENLTLLVRNGQPVTP